MSDFNELSGWVRNGLGHDLHTLYSTLIVRLSGDKMKHYWPVLIDPDKQAEMILRLVANSQSKFIPGVTLP